MKFSISTPLCIVFAIHLILAFINYPLIETLWRHSFDDGTYSHAYFIPFIVAYLFYAADKKGKFKLRQQLSLPWLAITVIAGMLLFMSTNAQLSIGYWLSYLILIISITFCLFEFNWRILFANLFLLFVVPLWGVLTIPLQSLAVTAVSFMMRLTGISILVEPPFIHIPEGIFEIAYGCSGLRYVLVSMVISSIYIFLFISKLQKALIFIVVALSGALLTNWIRITLLILIGHWTDMTSSLVYDHNNFGWYIYAPFMILLFFLGGCLADPVKGETTDRTALAQRLHFPSIIACIVIGLSSSLFIRNMGLPSLPTTNNEDLTDTEEPMIYYYEDIERKKTIRGKTLIFNFSPVDLDSKPTFFANELVPKDWRLIEEEIHQDSRVLLVKNNAKYAAITAQYQLDDFSTGSASVFKKYRLMHSLSGHQHPRLVWEFSECGLLANKKVKLENCTAANTF